MKKVCFVSGTRAEYGLLKPLMQLVEDDKELQLQVVVTGMHLSPEFGLTYQQIEEDGFVIDKKIEMLLSADTSSAISKSCGMEMISLADAFSELCPNMLVLLGDRYESFTAAVIANLADIPIAHLHGGELTEGALDDAMRHSITKLSYLHFTSTEEYRRRVIQLGEHPNRVFCVGAIGIDAINTVSMLEKKELEESLGFDFGAKTALVTFHPVTLETNTAELEVKNLLKALSSYQDMKIIFTKSNADAEGRIINQLIDHYVSEHKHQSKAYTSLGAVRYLSCVKHCDVVIGNSSSGILEVPSFKKPTVNIGNRQAGRISSESVINCGNETQEIICAINKALSPEFKEIVMNAQNPYEGENTAEQIFAVIKANLMSEQVYEKEFYCNNVSMP